MPEKEHYYSMNAGVEATKAAYAYGHAHDTKDFPTKGRSLRAKTKALIAQNPTSGLQREKTPERRARFSQGLAIDFWS